MAMPRLAGAHVVHALAVDQKIAAGDRLQPGDHAQQRRLAAARRTDEDDELARASIVEIDAVDDLEVAEALDHLLQDDARHRTPPLTPTLQAAALPPNAGASSHISDGPRRSAALTAAPVSAEWYRAVTNSSERRASASVTGSGAARLEGAVIDAASGPRSATAPASSPASAASIFFATASDGRHDRPGIVAGLSRARATLSKVTFSKQRRRRLISFCEPSVAASDDQRAALHARG